jgi:hypothetical protein
MCPFDQSTKHDRRACDLGANHPVCAEGVFFRSTAAESLVLSRLPDDYLVNNEVKIPLRELRFKRPESHDVRETLGLYRDCPETRCRWVWLIAGQLR